MDRDSLTAVLEDAGLSQYQADAYVTVLELGSATATAVANHSEVPDPRIYDVLRDLEQQGYVETYQQDSLRARAFSPETVLEDLRDRASQFQAAADEIEHRWERPSVDSHSVNFVKREQTVLEHAEAAIDDAECQAMIAANADQLQALADSLADAVSRGVYVMVVYHPGTDAALPEDCDPTSIASTLRVHPDPTPFLTLVDRTITCFAPHDMSMNRFGIIVDDPSHAFVFRWFFTVAIWESATTVSEGERASGFRVCVNLPRCVRELQLLLADGAAVTVTAHVVNTRTEEPMTITGEVVDVSVDGSVRTDRSEAPAGYTGRPTLEVAADDRTYAIGDWGAIVEPYEAMRVEIESVDWP